MQFSDEPATSVGTPTLVAMCTVVVAFMALSLEPSGPFALRWRRDGMPRSASPWAVMFDLAKGSYCRATSRLEPAVPGYALALSVAWVGLVTSEGALPQADIQGCGFKSQINSAKLPPHLQRCRGKVL
jgi:hypothetical protein